MDTGEAQASPCSKEASMKLEVHERMALLPLLPGEGTYSSLKAIRRAREMISFTPEEVKFYELTTADGTTQWNTAKANEQIADVPVEEYITNVIRDKLVEINRKEKLTEAQLSIYDKFVVLYQ